MKHMTCLLRLHASFITTGLSVAVTWHRLDGMKRSIRLFMLLLVSLMLPINGMAQSLMGLGSLPISEPFESAATHAGHGSHGSHGTKGVDSHALDAMCSDCSHAEHNAGSVVCESGQECKTSSLLQVMSGEHPNVPSGQSLTVFSSEFLPAAVADAVWHPPRS